MKIRTQKMTKYEWKMEFARRLKARMEELDFTNTELAHLSGVSQGHISRIINGHLSPQGYTIHKLAKALSVEPSYLVDF